MVNVLNIQIAIVEDLFICIFIWPICDANINGLGVYEKVGNLREKYC